MTTKDRVYRLLSLGIKQEGMLTIVKEYHGEMAVIAKSEKTGREYFVSWYKTSDMRLALASLNK